MDPRACPRSPQDKGDFWETMKNRFVDKTAMLQAQELELKQKITQMEALLAAHQSQNAFYVSDVRDKDVPKVFPKRPESPVRDIPNVAYTPSPVISKPTPLQSSSSTKDCCSASFFKKVMENAKSILTLKCSAVHAIDDQPTKEVDDSDKNVKPHSPPSNRVTTAVIEESCSIGCLADDESTRNDCTADSYSQELNNTFSLSCSCKTQTAASIGTMTKSKKESTSITCSATQVKSSKQKVSSTVQSTSKSSSTEAEQDVVDMDCCWSCPFMTKTRTCCTARPPNQSHSSSPQSSSPSPSPLSSVPPSPEPTPPSTASKRTDTYTTCAANLSISSRSRMQGGNDGPFTNKKTVQISLNEDNQCSFVGSPILRKEDIITSAYQDRATTPTHPSRGTCPACSVCPQDDLTKDSIFSINSTDLANLRAVAELATRGKEIKCHIQELQIRERNFTNEYSTQTNHVQAASCICSPTSERPAANVKMARFSEDLTLENQSLKAELNELKLELKHCREKMEGPMIQKLETERARCCKLQQDLSQASQSMVMNEDSHMREINALKLQLCMACSNITEMNTMNKRLKDEMASLDCMCSKLEDDLMKQKLSEAETIRRLSKRNAGKEDKNQCVGTDIPSPRSDDSFRCDSNLHIIARKLSRTLKESEPCEECANLPAELTGAAKCIKDLTDMVESRKNKNLIDSELLGEVKKDGSSQSPRNMNMISDSCQCCECRDSGAGDDKLKPTGDAPKTETPTAPTEALLAPKFKGDEETSEGASTELISAPALDEDEQKEGETISTQPPLTTSFREDEDIEITQTDELLISSLKEDEQKYDETTPTEDLAPSLEKDEQGASEIAPVETSLISTPAEDGQKGIEIAATGEPSPTLEKVEQGDSENVPVETLLIPTLVEDEQKDFEITPTEDLAPTFKKETQGDSEIAPAETLLVPSLVKEEEEEVEIVATEELAPTLEIDEEGESQIAPRELPSAPPLITDEPRDEQKDSEMAPPEELAPTFDKDDQEFIEEFSVISPTPIKDEQKDGEIAPTEARLAPAVREDVQIMGDSEITPTETLLPPMFETDELTDKEIILTQFPKDGTRFNVPIPAECHCDEPIISTPCHCYEDDICGKNIICDARKPSGATNLQPGDAAKDLRGAASTYYSAAGDSVAPSNTLVVAAATGWQQETRPGGNDAGRDYPSGPPTGPPSGPPPTGLQPCGTSAICTVMGQPCVKPPQPCGDEAECSRFGAPCRMLRTADSQLQPRAVTTNVSPIQLHDARRGDKLDKVKSCPSCSEDGPCFRGEPCCPSFGKPKVVKLVTPQTPRRVHMDMGGLTSDQIGAVPASAVPRGVQLDTAASLGRAVPFKEERTGYMPFDIETAAVLDEPPPDLHVTTTITRSGSLLVVTEGPGGVIETTLVYMDDGTIEVTTQITDAETTAAAPRGIDYTQQKPSDITDMSQGEQPISSSFETSVYSAPAESDLQRELMLAEEKGQSLLSGETGLTGIETASEHGTTGKDSLMLSSSVSGFDDVAKAGTIGTTAKPDTADMSVAVGVSLADRGGGEMAAAPEAVFAEDESEQVLALSEALTEEEATDKISALSEATGGDRTSDKISTISEAAEEEEATDKISVVSEGAEEGGDEIVAVSEAAVEDAASGKISTRSEAEAGDKASYKSSERSKAATGEAGEEISAISEAGAEAEASDKILTHSEAGTEGAATYKSSGHSTVETEASASKIISAISEVKTETESDKISTLSQAGTTIIGSLKDSRHSKAEMEDGTCDKISAISDAEAEVAASDKISTRSEAEAGEKASYKGSEHSKAAAEEGESEKISSVPEAGIEEGVGGAASAEIASGGVQTEGSEVLAISEEAEAEPQSGSELLEEAAEQEITNLYLESPESKVSKGMAEIVEELMPEGQEAAPSAAEEEAECVTAHEGSEDVVARAKSVESEGAEGLALAKVKEATSAAELGEEEVMELAEAGEILPFEEAKEGEVLSHVEVGEVVPPTESEETFKSIVEDEEGEAATPAQQLEDVRTDEMVSEIDETSDKRQALKKRDCSCQSAPPIIDQSCQCCECKNIGVSTAQDSETNTDENMVQTTSKPTVQTIPEESEQTENTETEFAEAASLGTGKIQGTIDDVTTINEEDVGTESAQDDSPKQPQSEADGDGPGKDVDGEGVKKSECVAICSVPVDKSTATEVSERTTQETTTDSIQDAATDAPQESRSSGRDEISATDKGMDETLTDASMQYNAPGEDQTEEKPSSVSEIDEDKSSAAPKMSDEVTESKATSVSAIDEDKSKPSSKSETDDYNTVSKISAPVPEPKQPSSSESDEEKSKSKISAEVPDSQLPSEISDSKKPRKKRSPRLESMQCLCPGICQCVICSPEVIAKRKAFTGSTAPPGPPAQRGQEARLCCCTPPSPTQPQTCQATGAPPGMSTQQPYTSPRTQTYPNQHPVSCGCPTCMCAPIRPPAVEAFLRSTDLSKKPAPKSRKRISIEDVFVRLGKEAKCTAECTAECTEPGEKQCSAPYQKPPPPKYEAESKRGQYQKGQAHKYERGRHPRNCECVDCLCLPRIKKIAETKEYPIVKDKKQIYQVHTMKCVCLNSSSKKISKIPIATNSSASPPKVRGSGICTCNNCPCSPCNDPNISAGGTGGGGAKPSDVSKDCTCTNCTCYVCPKTREATVKSASKKNCCCLGECTCELCPVETLQKTTSTVSHPVDCDCAECVCSLSESKIGGGGITPKVSEMQSKALDTSASNHPANCDCPECDCPQAPSGLGGAAPESNEIGSKTVDVSKATPKSDQAVTGAAGKPPGCTCDTCACPGSTTTNVSIATPKLDQKATTGVSETAGKPAGCTCDTCACPGGPSSIAKLSSKIQAPIGCSCSVCSCPNLGSSQSSRSAPLARTGGGGGGGADSPIADCDCDVCQCNPCADPKRRNPDLGANVAPCDCVDCQCDPCADPNRRKQLAGMGLDCDCGQCDCAETETQTTTSGHHDECSCDLCACISELQETERTIAGFSEDKETHARDCTCNECACAQGQPAVKTSTKEVGNDDAEHAASCTCQECLCVDCKSKQISRAGKTSSTSHPIECDCSNCVCKPCPRLTKSAPDGLKMIGKDTSTTDHPPDCDCVECFCPRSKARMGTAAPYNTSTECQAAPNMIGQDTSTTDDPPDCDCVECFCPRSKARMGSGAPVGVGASAGGEAAPKMIGTDTSTMDHPPDCDCVECFCPRSKARMGSAGPYMVGADTSTTAHPADCDCVECLCNTAADESAFKMATSSTVHPDDCDCAECLCNEGLGGVGTSVEVCVCPPCCDCGAQTDGSLPVTESGAGENKPSRTAAKGAVRHKECPMCTCLDSFIVDTGVDNKGLQVGSKSQAGKGDESRHTVGCTCPECCACEAADADVSKLNDDQLKRKIESDKQENCECRQQMNEIRRALDKIKCACNEAELKATHNAQGKPFVKQASSFGQTMSGLKLALTNLQEKCKAKDRMIDVMTGELKLRTSSNTLEQVMNTKTAEEPPDYDKAADVQSPPPRSKVSTNVLYSVAEEQDITATRARRGGDERSGRHKKRSKGCKCGKSHKSKDGGAHNVDLSGFEIIDIRRITQDSIIIKWKPPKNNTITGYDIFVNGVNKSRVMSGGRTSAMIHSLDLSATIQITIYAVTKSGRCEPPAIAIYEID